MIRKSFSNIISIFWFKLHDNFKFKFVNVKNWFVITVPISMIQSMVRWIREGEMDSEIERLTVMISIIMICTGPFLTGSRDSMVLSALWISLSLTIHFLLFNSQQG